MRKLALFAMGFALSTVILVYFWTDIRILWVAGFALVLSPVCMKLGLGRCCAVLLGLSAGVLWCFGYKEVWLSPVERVCNTELVLQMEIAELPQATDYGTKAEVEVTLEGRTYRALLYGEEGLLEAEPGDTVTGTVKIVDSLSEDEDRWYGHRASGIVLLLYGQEEMQLEQGTPPWPTALRMWFQTRIREHYPEGVVPLLLALLTGDQRELSYSLRNDLSVTGLSHAVAVSGLHVSVVLSVLVMLCGHNPRLTALLGVPLSVAFVLMTGASPSACRSAVMQTLMVTAPLVRREADSWTSLAAACLLLLLENPWNIASVSFQLSFSAVAGLILFASPLQNQLLGKRPGRLRRVVASGVSACLSATITTMPLTVYYFGIFSLGAVLANLLALWAMNAMLMLGLISCFLGFVAFPVTILSRYVLLLVEHMARFPYVAAYEQNLPLQIWAVLAYGLAVWLLLWKKQANRWPIPLMALTFLLCVLYGGWNYSHDAPVYRVLDVGQGQCILLETGEVTVMVDCGGESPEKAGEQAARALHSGGKSRVDVLILTHYDADHAGGVTQLLHRVSVGMILLPDIRDGSGMRQSIEEAVGEDTKIMPISQLTELTFSGGKLTVFPPLDRVDDNNGGICVLATASECDMLITGDLDQLTEMRLLSHWKLPQVEVLVAGHHGAGTSTGKTLLETVQPKTVVISVGADNAYGHPVAETLERITKVGAKILRTDKEGTIVIRKG